MSSKKPIVVVKKEPGSRPEAEGNGGATRSGGSGLCPCLCIFASARADVVPPPRDARAALVLPRNSFSAGS